MQNRIIYYIPNNYLDSGTILNGRFSVRNAVEGIVLALAGYFICNMLPITHGLEGISNYILVCGPLLLIGAAGVNNEPLSQFLMNMYKWRKRKNPCFYNGGGKAYHTSAAELLIDEPTLRDKIAEKVQQIRASLRSPAVEYVEGQNYLFSSDPELEALDAAEERRMRQEEESSKPEPIKPSASASDLDLNEIFTNIELLDDYEEE